MTEPNNHFGTDSQNKKIMESLKNEIASLKFQLTKKDDRIASLDAMFKPIMESHNAGVRAYENLKDELEDVIEMLRKRVPHGNTLDFLKGKDRNSIG